MNSIFKLSLVVSCSALIAACGSKAGTASSQGKAVGVFSKVGASQSLSASILEARKEALVTARNVAHEALFTKLRNQAVMSDCGLSVSGPEGASCTNTCSEPDTNIADGIDVKINSSCSGTSVDGKCGDVTFTMKDYAFTYDVAISMPADFKTITVKFAGVVKGTASSSDSSVTGAVDCKMSMAMTQDTSSQAQPDMKCSDGEFSCTVGGQTLSCADLEASANSCK